MANLDLALLSEILPVRRHPASLSITTLDAQPDGIDVFLSAANWGTLGLPTPPATPVAGSFPFYVETISGVGGSEAPGSAGGRRIQTLHSAVGIWVRVRNEGSGTHAWGTWQKLSA